MGINFEISSKNSYCDRNVSPQKSSADRCNFTSKEKVAKELSSNPLRIQILQLHSERIIDKRVSLKKKRFGPNDGPLMTRELRKEIMKCSKLKTNFNKVEKK